MAQSTKALAKKLGALKIVTPIKPAERAEKINNPVKQKFDYVFVIDFESTCWEDRGKKAPSSEIIEFPAVLLNLKTGQIESQFQQYVFPTEQPRLSAFCEKLTGITQATVEKGVPLATCLLLFRNWLTILVEKFNLEFHKRRDEDSNTSLCTIVTWSDWDLTVCLNNECRRKNITKPKLFNSWIDLRLTYRKFYNRLKGLKGAMEDLGLQFQGQEHSGLDDSLNTARLAFKMAQDGCLLDVTKSMDSFTPFYNRNDKFAPVKTFWR